MDTSQLDPTPTPTRPGESDLDLYTIPSSSSWFTWYDIHETEKIALKEFFDGTSITRTPKIYKEYRDFIINKYRQDPSKILTFTEIRKSLVGDVSLLRKVFNFLNQWGLINFSANRPDPGPISGSEAYLDANPELGPGWGKVVRVEEGAPNGVRVVATPSAMKPISLPQSVESGVLGSNGESVVMKLPSLASFGDVFEQGMRGGAGGVWSEEETLGLLEVVMKYGNDWEVVAQNVKTKSREECIAKIIELPFGDLMLSNKVIAEQKVADGLDKQTKKMRDESSDKLVNLEEGEVNGEGPPLKRQCVGVESLVSDDHGSALMKQVAHLASMASPDIVVAAAEAAVAAVCEETACPREVFDGIEEDFLSNGMGSPTDRVDEVKDSENKERAIQAETQEASHPLFETLEASHPCSDVPLSLRLRAAIATSLGAAASHAKLLADQEEREMENLMATVLDTQMKKLQQKVNHFDDLELLMEKEHAELEEIKESLTEERVDVLQRIISSGISKLRDHASVKSHSGTVF